MVAESMQVTVEVGPTESSVPGRVSFMIWALLPVLEKIGCHAIKR
jgi:hypothetical protein